MGPYRIPLLLLSVYFGVTLAQMKNTAPETIQSCYRNITALNRVNRQPMHIDNLIAIIRKIEQKSLHFRDMRRMARTIVKRFQFDGIYHDPDKSIDLQFSPHPSEANKNEIIHDLIPDNADILPNDILDNDERCALHWMVSHSLNATMRDDEQIERYQRQRYDGGLRAKRAMGSNTRITNRPIETGTVYTPWGPVSGGRVIAGIAAGLMEKSIPVIYKSEDGGILSDPGNNYPGNNNPGTGGGYPNTGGGYPNSGGGYPNSGGGNNWGNNPPQPQQPQYNNNPWSYGRRNKRQIGMIFDPLQNIHAATLAGDIGQAAILNSPYIQRISGVLPPIGTWNDTICPREYILNRLPDPQADPSHAHDTWSYMTGAEIRGGMDGLILGAKAKDLAGKQYTLSQVLEMYYSEDGVYGETNFRACDRISLYPSSVDGNVVKEQSRSFAYFYNSKVKKVIVDPNNFNTLVDQAYSKMNQFQSTISSDPSCVRRTQTGGFAVPDQDKVGKPMATIYAILDHSSVHPELVAQQRFLAKLAYDLDVSPDGSRIGLVDGRTGQVLISPNWTDTAPILACKIISQPLMLQRGNIAQVLRSLKSEFVRVRDEQARRGEAYGNRIMIMIFVQGKKLEESDRSSILDALEEYDEEFGDIQITYVSSKYNKQDFVNFMLDDRDSNFIPIVQSGGGNLSDSTESFLKEFQKRSFGILTYPQCNEYRFPNQDDELKKATHLFIKPNTIQYFIITPSSFFSSVDLRLRFSSDNGKVRICVSKETRELHTETHPINYNEEENKDREIECAETSGTYMDPESMKKDVEFIFTKPCKNRKREGCYPIYLSITPTDVPSAAGAVGPDCSQFGCKTPDEVKVTWTHYDMRCNGAFKTTITSTFSLSILLSIFYSFKYFS